MSRGKYLSLEEARKAHQLDRFCKEHLAEAERDRFFQLLDAMATGALEDKETSQPVRGAGSSDSRTQPDTSEDASRKPKRG
jgi:hypothetical protein